MGKSKSSKTKAKQKHQEPTLRKSRSTKGFGVMSPSLNNEGEEDIQLLMELEDYGKYHLDTLTTDKKLSRRKIVTLEKYFLHIADEVDASYIIGSEKDSAYSIVFFITLEQTLEITLHRHRTFVLELLPKGCIDIPIPGKREGCTKPYIPYKLVNFLVCTGLDS